MTAAALGDGVDFALLGHQESWDQIATIVRSLRPRDSEPVSLGDIRSIVPWIPARTVSRVQVRSLLADAPVRGVYIDTFITPDELRHMSVRSMLTKVKAAARVAEREGARIASLGGFTSILLEGGLQGLSDRVVFTTGNSLTAALVVNGVERAAGQLGLSLERATCLVIGGTGDVGSACARWLGPRVQRLLLAARPQGRLDTAVEALRHGGTNAVAVADLSAALGEADVIVSVASTSEAAFDLSLARHDALICDAGYPKNLRPGSHVRPHLFHGGLGRSLGRFWSDDGMLERFYAFPLDYVGHGCMLEGLLLAVAGRYEPFSQGRGNITADRIDEIWTLAAAHGFVLAPFFNHDGLWPAP
ncbi:MAG: hypothetical protein ABMA00_12625 [Gemmatimonas sp.]